VRKNSADINSVKHLLQKALKYDDNLLEAQMALGRLHHDKGDENISLEIYMNILIQAEKVGDKSLLGYCIREIGTCHKALGNYNKALDYYMRALEIFNEINNKDGLAKTYNGLAIIYGYEGNLEKSIYYLKCSLDILEKLGSTRGICVILGNLAWYYQDVGEFDKCSSYTHRSIEKCNQLGIETRLMGGNLKRLGYMHFRKGNYKDALENFQKSLLLLNNIEITKMNLSNNIMIAICHKYLEKGFNERDILQLIKIEKKIGYELNLRLYELLEDKTHLETAYNQIQAKADNLEPDVAAKFLSYPIPKAIVEEYNKVFKK